jgi:hypothetical protein
MDTQKQGKVVAIVGFVVLVIGVMVGRFISVSSSTAPDTMLNQWLAGEHPLNTILPIVGLVIVAVGMQMQRTKK